MSCICASAEQQNHLDRAAFAIKEARLIRSYIEDDTDGGVEGLRRPDAGVRIAAARHVRLCAKHHPVATCAEGRSLGQVAGD